MAKLLIVLVAVVVAVSARRIRPRVLGPTVPWNNADASQCQPSLKFADQLNMCWYHQCMQDSEGGYYLMPMECGLGTRLTYMFRPSVYNPCTHHYSGDAWYECSREHANVKNTFCKYNTVCKNGGTVVEENGKCWCECPAEWNGDSDCSKRTAEPKPVAASDKCVDGKPEKDYCEEAGGCLNGGVCHNQCGGFWCDCPSPYRFGKRCERFSCERDGECFNGGECRRGLSKKNEFRRCICPEGFTGYRCEKDIRHLA